ncbi:MAG: hypothetical protein IAG13_19260 [Deltaproteobacteria bacterium]|nr:hypothetical protein [Nannocystaceae bacterium]
MARRFANLLGCAGLFACSLEAELKEQPCDVDDDCWKTQQCARTDVERTLELPGVCQPRDIDCVKGEQLGCACVPGDSALSCYVQAVDLRVEYPDMVCDPTQMICVLADMGESSEG